MWKHLRRVVMSFVLFIEPHGISFIREQKTQGFSLQEYLTSYKLNVMFVILNAAFLILCVSG